MNAGLVAIRPGAPEHDAARDAFVLAHPRGTFFHLAGWKRVVGRVFGHRDRELLAFDGPDLVGVLPLMESPRPFGGVNLVSIPYGVYGGPLGASREVEQALVTEATRMADLERVGFLELRYLDDPGQALVGSSLYSTFIRDLPEKREDVLARMPKKARAEARKAVGEHGLELVSGVWYVDDLYRLFLRNKHGLGSPALPPRMFAELVREFRDRLHVHIVRYQREPVAAVMSFVYRETLVAYYSGTRPGADRAVSASNFMYMALQQWAVDHGFKTFDFGRSRAESGAFRFKVHQGFEPQALHYRFHLVRKRSTPSFTPSNPRTSILQAAWRKLPLWLARRLSDRISGYLP